MFWSVLSTAWSAVLGGAGRWRPAAADPSDDDLNVHDPWRTLASDSGLTAVDDLTLRGVFGGFPARISVSTNASLDVCLSLTLRGPRHGEEGRRQMVNDRLVRALASDNHDRGLGAPWLRHVLRERAAADATVAALADAQGVAAGRLTAQISWDPTGGPWRPMCVLWLLSWAAHALEWPPGSERADAADPRNRDGLSALLCTVTDSDASERMIAKAMRGNFASLPEALLIELVDRDHPQIRLRALRGLYAVGTERCLPAVRPHANGGGHHAKLARAIIRRVTG